MAFDRADVYSGNAESHLDPVRRVAGVGDHDLRFARAHVSRCHSEPTARQASRLRDYTRARDPLELISEVVEIEKAQVTERAYPPGITNRR